ncbi:hypothetical protein CHS0354_021961 [Potamilus streckersoni]|uniref:EF-hand domain-containing protein n=1 Tax=Potamilus streckersoni TaxID=2493646 RepID=A0AAE0VY06_9BIVA|nr:hypothetical protein CHS0354_021961 [Potamilus streckersoni]
MGKMMFAILCSVLIGSVSGAATTDSTATTALPGSMLFNTVDVHPKDGVISNAEFHKAAYIYDLDGNGTITETEFVSKYQSALDVSQSQAVASFAAIDFNRDGVFDDKEISAVFNIFDVNLDGQITLTEFQTGFAHIASGHGSNN